MKLSAIEKQPAPNRLLTIGVAITTAALLWMAFAEYVQYRFNSIDLPQQIRTSQLSQLISRINEVQGMLLVMAVETGDPRWEKRFRDMEPEEEVAIQEATALATSVAGRSGVAQMEAADHKLLEVEDRIFELVRSRNLDQARALLHGNTYEAQNRVYSMGLALVASELDALVKTSLRVERENTLRNMLVAVGVTFVLLVGWVFLLRTFSGWQAALGEANSKLKRDMLEIQRLDKVKSEFVSTVSHELRTPLTSIRGSLGLIAGGVAGKLPDAASGLVDIAKNNCERLIRLINDILDTEKIESGQMRFEPRVLELRPLLEQALTANASFAAQHNVKVNLEAPEESLRADVDGDRLTQVITNLLSNAVKFSPSGGAVRVHVARAGDRVRIEVIDCGPGIPDAFRHRIFEKFSQADSSDTRPKGGSGLGLNISKAIVERLGGKIGFTTEVGVGTTFHFELPLWMGKSAVSIVAKAPRALATPRILVCEDDRDIAQLLVMILERAGYDADLAYSAAEAQERLAAQPYAAMTVDLKLPDLDGITLIRELRRQPHTADLPIIVVSAKAEEGRIKLNGETLSVADWMGKPIDESRLIMNIHKAVDDMKPGGPHLLHVLHIEDDPDVQRIVATLSQGFANFEFAATLTEARARLHERKFDLVLLDIMLPDGSGWSLIDDINGLSPAPPVVVFSAKDPTKAESARAAAVLVKSRTSNEELLETIHRVLERAAVPATVGS